MKIKLILTITVIMGLILISYQFLSAIDTPHNESNNVYCGSCHGQGLLDFDSPFWGGSGTYDQICLSCHYAPSGPYSDINAPLVTTHSSETTSTNYGDWSRECIDCHDPHYQLQKNYKSTDASRLYLATGTITACLYNGDNTSTLTYSTISYKSGWNATKLTQKTLAYRRTVLFPNVGKLGYNYPIIAVDEISIPPTITVSGNACTYLYPPTTYAAMYGQYVKNTIDLSGTSKTVKFLDQTGTNSFADDNTTYDGVCEVCHTQTTHYRNDGSGSDQHHMNVGGADATNCISCHPHTNGFAHGGGGGTGCSCHGDSGSHYKHINVDPPAAECSDCHNTSSYPTFADNQDLSNTDVCDTCHSPGGSYNGVNSVNDSVGAKDNWVEGIYEGDDHNILKAGKEKWCAGCHDNVPSVIEGTSAPDIVGNNSSYGFYLVAHGNATMGVNRQSVSYAQGECVHCHDVSIGGHGGQLFAPLDNPDFCMTCHTSSGSVQVGGIANGPGNIATVFGKTYRHNVTGYSGLHKFSPEDENRTYLSANKHVECNDCHDPHSAKSGLHSSNAVHVAARTDLVSSSGQLTGATGVEPAWSSNNWGGGFDSPTIHLPRTGQTTNYASGDDGALQKGVAWPSTRFTDNGNSVGSVYNAGTFTDNLTGLIWPKDASNVAWGKTACNPGTAKTWQGALDYVACLNANNYLYLSDWRLPNREELESLINTEVPDTSAWLNSLGFITNVQSYLYWSSTTYASNTASAWVIDMHYGDIVDYTKTNSDARVWVVRGGTGNPAPLRKTGQITSYATTGNFTINGTVTDSAAWSPISVLSSNLLYATNGAGNKLYEFNLNTGSLYQTLNLSANGITLAGVNSSGYLIGMRWNSSASREEFGTIDYTTGAFTIIGYVSDSAAWTPPSIRDGTTYNILYGVNGAGNKLYIFDSYSGSLIRYVNLSTNGITLAGSYYNGRYGNLIATRWNSSTSTEEIGLIDTVTGAFNVIGSVSASAAWTTPSILYNNLLCATNSAGNKLYVFNTDTDSLYDTLNLNANSIILSGGNVVYNKLLIGIRWNSSASREEVGGISMPADDGILQMGVKWPGPRFIDNGDGTITDRLTGLMWTGDANAPGSGGCSPGTAKTWQAALDYAACLNANSYLNYTDWRVPNKKELESLINAGATDTSAWLNSHGFINAQPSLYWSSSTYASNTASAWVIDMHYGDIVDYTKTNSDARVWAVRTASWSTTWPTTWPSTSSTATKEPQICFKCHSSYNTNPSGWNSANTDWTNTTGTSAWTDVALEFNPANASYHPVVQALPPSQQLPPAFISVVIGDSGLATSATTSSLTDTTKSWTSNKWQNWGLRVGTLSGISTSLTDRRHTTYNGVRRITSNTPTVLNVDAPFYSTINSYKDTYSIEYYAGRSTKSGTTITDTNKNFNLYLPSLVGYVVVIVDNVDGSGLTGDNVAKGTVISNTATSFTVDNWTIINQGVPANGTVGYYFSATGHTMMCSDCHSNDTISSAAAQGPHGSAVKWMLKGRNRAWPSQSASQNGTGTGTLFEVCSNPSTGGSHRSIGDGLDIGNGLFCLNCHSTVIFSKDGKGREGDNIPHTRHTYSTTAMPKCANCHVLVPHGSKISRLIGDGDSNMPSRYAFNNNLSNMQITSFRKASDPSSYSTANCYVRGDASTGCRGMHTTGSGLDEDW
jgi:hypothetical protein